MLSERRQTHLFLFCYWLQLLPHFFRPVSFYPKLPAPLPFFCLRSISDLLWNPQGSHSLHFHFPVPVITAAHPPGHCVTPSWALQIHNSASWRRCCFLRACLEQSKHLADQLEGHPKDKSVCQLLWLCCYSPITSSTLTSNFCTKWLCLLLHTPIPSPLHFSSAVLKTTIVFFPQPCLMTLL